MKSDRWQKIDEIFHAALQQKPEDREAFIEDACGGDGELRREVRSLVSVERAADNFLEEPAMEVVAKEFADDQKETLLGKKLVRTRSFPCWEREGWARSTEPRTPS